MQKVQIVIKCFFIIHLSLIYSIVNAQNTLVGSYSKLEIGQEYFDYYKFNQQGGFEYFNGASLGYNYYGKGDYTIIHDLLILDFNKTELKKYSGYYRYNDWINNSNTVILKFKVFDIEGNKIPNVNIYFLKNKIGRITDKNGYAEIILKKSNAINDDINISLIGFEPQKIKIDRNYNFNFKIYLKKRDIKSYSKPIYNQKDTLEIINLDEDLIKLRGKNGKISSWRKVR